MHEQDLAQARAAVESLLSALDVVRVAYVDDINNKSISVEDVIAAAQSLSAPSLLTTFPEIGDPIPDDRDVLTAKVRQLWVQLDTTVQAKRGQAVVVAARRHDADNETDDVADISILNQIIPEDKLISLSPEQWVTRKEQLLQESKIQRTLFLFDQDFSNAGGDSEAGIKIIASLLARSDAENLICGLLTHTVTPETQPEQWVCLSAAHGINRDRFIVIPKLHLSQAPMLFAQTLKFIALSPDFAELKDKTKKIINDAAETAASRVEKINIDDLEHIVFQVSADEGLWEPDMLFRLHALFHRLESRQLAYAGEELETIAAKLRAVSGIPTQCDMLPIPRSAWALQREELYESDEHINRYHLPLELGDIFEKVGGTSRKKYILLAQPCDLMVRSGGRREPELLRIPLAEVVPDRAPKYSEELPYFDVSPENKWFVNFKSIHFVRICLLDLCVFNQDGVARLAVGGNAPSGIRPTWKERYNILSRNLIQEVSKTTAFVPVLGEAKAMTQFKEKIAKDLIGRLFDDDLFKGKLTKTDDDTRSITYNCKRVGRLSRARAIGLLMSYTATLARPAYDPFFGNVPESAT